jgi:hypothetical protein
MKNISHFINFKNLNAPVIQWFAEITRISQAHPIFCNTFSNPNQKVTAKSVILEADTVGDFSEHRPRKTTLPLELRNTFNSKTLFPVFNADEVLESDRLLSEIIDTELLLISCPAIDEEKGLKLDALTSKIINKAKCPIVLIPENVNNPEKISRVIYNSDIRFTELRLVKAIARLCRTLRTKLTLAHVSDNGIPDLGIDYGKNLFKDCFENRIGECEFDMENIKKLDIQKYPDLIHEFLRGDIYAMANKNKHFKDGDYLSSTAVKFAAIAKRPILIINA